VLSRLQSIQPTLIGGLLVGVAASTLLAGCGGTSPRASTAARIDPGAPTQTFTIVGQGVFPGRCLESWNRWIRSDAGGRYVGDLVSMKDAVILGERGTCSVLATDVDTQSGLIFVTETSTTDWRLDRRLDEVYSRPPSDNVAIAEDGKLRKDCTSVAGDNPC
jgi:hypothetical protein